MDRRQFLSWLGGTAAGVAASATLDVEKLLWVPGAKSILVPEKPRLYRPGDLKVGDIFTIAGHYTLNPYTRERKLMEWIVTADVPTVSFRPRTYAHALRP